jgi:hypothetical protein
VISGQLFYRADADHAGFRVFFFGFFKHHEMPHQIQQGSFVQHAV